MVENRWRICSIFFLSCVGLPICGCLYATYPETYDASDFEEFQYRYETDPPCLDYPFVQRRDDQHALRAGSP